ncbi:MAG: Fic family protein [Saprospiraceae bacterium]
MSYVEEINAINLIQEQLKPLLPLSSKADEGLWKKLRLEWNFNSNHIEGNTLTYMETKLFLILGNTSGDHKAREYDEMKAHDLAIEIVKDWAKDVERKITEKEIWELNKIILVEPFWKEAQTPDGSFTMREIIPGQYKKFPNHVRLENGGIFKYTEPEDVVPEMKELLDWYHQTYDLHPVVKSALLHYKFVRIHPFDDGNGRIARLLMNYHLILNGYAPIIIKSVDKKNYIFALNKADVGDMDAFIEYISKQSNWSMSLFLSAAKNENIEEDEDWKKQVSMISKNNSVKPVKRNLENLKLRVKDTIIPLIITIKDDLGKNFGDLFGQIKYKFIFNSQDFSPDLMNNHFDMLYNLLDIAHTSKDLEMELEIEMKDFNRNGIYVFNISTKIVADIAEYSYTIRSVELVDLRISRGYDRQIDELGIKDFVNQLGKYIYYQIENRVK